MASLRRHPNSPHYIACFTGADGRRYQRSTKVVHDGKVESRRKAQKIADDYEDVARRMRTAQQAQIVIQELYEQATGTALATMTSRAFAVEWLQDKQGSVDPKTLAFYRTRVDSFLDLLEVRADQSLHLVSEKDVREWRDAEVGRVSVTTTNLGLKAIRMYLGDACKRGLIPHNVAVRVPILKKAPVQKRRPFTVEELQQLLPHLSDEWKSLVMFGLYTGQRLGDLASLHWHDIDLTAGEIRFTTRKTGRAQKIPIAPALKKHIARIGRPNRADAPVHPDARKSVEVQKGSVSTLSRQFHDSMSKAGLVPKRMHRKREDKVESKRNMSDLTFHGLRHTLTSMLKNAGVSSAVAEEIVGHDSSEMNRIYTHIEQSSLKKAMDLLPEL